MQSQVVREYIFPNSGLVLQVRKGDMTKEKVKVIVNAANAHLRHGAGLAGAIIKAGGEIIQIESLKIARQRDLVPGDVVETTSGRLKQDIGIESVFHAVGPLFPLLNTKANLQELMTLDEDHELYSCVFRSLEMANDKNYDSISLPAISSGIFGFPKDRCAKILFNAVEDFNEKFGGDSALKHISFTNFDDSTVDIFSQEFDLRKYKSDIQNSEYEDNSENDSNNKNENNNTSSPTNS